MPKNMNLYISIGNTRTTFAYFPNNITSIKIIKKNTKEFFNKMNFDEILSEFNILIKQIFVCSVVKEANAKLKIYFVNQKIIFLNHDNQKLIKLNQLENPHEVGNDIIAAAIYAAHLSDNTTVLSLGTASVISSIINSSLAGCIITPGLEISYNALIENTDIPKIKLTYTSKNIGKNTQEALSIGMITGHKILLEELAKKFHNEKTLYVYFGGNTSYIKLNNWKKIKDMDLLGLYLFSINL